MGPRGVWMPHMHAGGTTVQLNAADKTFGELPRLPSDSADTPGVLSLGIQVPDTTAAWSRRRFVSEMWFSKKKYDHLWDAIFEWKKSQKKSIFSKVRKPNKWTSPRRKYLSQVQKATPDRTATGAQVYVEDWISSLKMGPFSEPSLNWAKSHEQEQGALIITIDTREHRETVEKYSEKVFRTYGVFCFVNRWIENAAWLPAVGRLSALEQSTNEVLHRRHGPYSSSLMCLGKLQANAPPVCGTMIVLGWIKNAKNRWKMHKNDQNTTFLTLLGCQVVP